MTIAEIINIGTAVLLSLGTGGVIVFAFSSWLGKVWANRLMEAEKAKYQNDLEIIRSDLARENHQHALNYKEKIDLYRGISEPVIRLIVSIKATDNLKTSIDEFEYQRLCITALLGMFAPMSVYDKYNDMIDYLYNCLEAKDVFDFAKFRDIAHKFLTEVRKDIGLYSDEARYIGNR